MHEEDRKLFPKIFDNVSNLFKKEREITEILSVQCLHLMRARYSEGTLASFARKRVRHSFLLLSFLLSFSYCLQVWRKFGDRLPHDDNCNYTTADDIKKLCDRLEPRVAVTMTEIESRFIIDGNLATTAKGQLAVDFIVEAAHFVEKAPEPLKSEVTWETFMH